jgi:hypothetical protein
LAIYTNIAKIYNFQKFFVFSGVFISKTHFKMKAKNTKVITPEVVKELIAETATYLQKKEEVIKKVLELEAELKVMSENYQGFAGAFGFATPGDISNKSKTGFVTDSPVGRISQLGAEIEQAMKASEPESTPTINEDVMLEISKMKEEIAALKKENAKLKK